MKYKTPQRQMGFLFVVRRRGKAEFADQFRGEMQRWYHAVGIPKQSEGWVVTQFGSGKNEQMPASKAGGLYKINFRPQWAVL